MSEHDLQQQLQQPAPTPNADTKARHIGAAMTAFAAQQTSQKKSNILQGFLQRLRLTRDTNHHGSDLMSNSSFDNRSVWQNRHSFPVLLRPALLCWLA